MNHEVSVVEQLVLPSLNFIGVARGCSGCTCTPRVVKIVFRPNLQEMCKCTPRTRSAPPARARVNF